MIDRRGSREKFVANFYKDLCIYNSNFLVDFKTPKTES